MGGAASNANYQDPAPAASGGESEAADPELLVKREGAEGDGGGFPCCRAAKILNLAIMKIAFSLILYIKYSFLGHFFAPIITFNMDVFI